MKFALLAAPAVILVAVVTLAMSSPSPQQSKPTPEEMKAMMARWEKACEVRPQHKRLAALVGKWEVTNRLWLGGPGSKPFETKGASEVKWLVEDRWLEMTTTVPMMGKQITTVSQLGYDDYKERFVASFIDSHQTDLRTASGIFTQDAKHLILWGFMDEPGTPESDKCVKYVYRNFGQDTWQFEVHDMMIGEENTKVAEFEFKRVK